MEAKSRKRSRRRKRRSSPQRTRLVEADSQITATTEATTIPDWIREVPTSPLEVASLIIERAEEGMFDKVFATVQKADVDRVIVDHRFNYHYSRAPVAALRAQLPIELLIRAATAAAMNCLDQAQKLLQLALLKRAPVEELRNLDCTLRYALNDAKKITDACETELTAASPVVSHGGVSAANAHKLTVAVCETLWMIPRIQAIFLETKRRGSRTSSFDTLALVVRHWKIIAPDLLKIQVGFDWLRAMVVNWECNVLSRCSGHDGQLQQPVAATNDSDGAASPKPRDVLKDGPMPDGMIFQGTRHRGLTKRPASLLHLLWRESEVTFDRLRETVWTDKSVLDHTIESTASRLTTWFLEKRLPYRVANKQFTIHLVKLSS